MVTCPDALPLKGGFHYRRKRGRKRSRKRSRESAYDLLKIEKSDQSRKLAGSCWRRTRSQKNQNVSISSDSAYDSYDSYVPPLI